MVGSELIETTASGQAHASRPPSSIRFATRADALAIAEMSRDLIEHGLEWSWTKERVRRLPAPSATPTSWSRCAKDEVAPASAS
jgi:hypothetical protein